MASSSPALNCAARRYGTSSHEDAVTAIGSSYTASYDAAGNMTCRAPTSSTTCAGTQTGAQLSYDNEGRMSGWQNAPSNPTSTTSNLYDGEGNRVEQFIANGSTTTAITYIANLEEVSTTAGITSTTTSYYAAGQRIAQAVNGVFSYLGSDGLGSAEVALDGSGNVQASALYDPYGNGRYSSGSMPGTYGYTGQRTDAATDLDYYQARYYDAVAGQFTSADSVQDGLNRYAYVGGNPETATDPTGHMFACVDGCGGNTTTTPTCNSDASCSDGWGPPPTQSTSSTGGSGGSSGRSNSALTWVSWELNIFGIQIDGYALATALEQNSVRDTIDFLRSIVENLILHPSRVKFGGRFNTRVSQLETAESGADMLDKVSAALIGLGALADFAGATIAFYNGNTADPRWDLSGPERLAAAVWYGLIHALFVTALAIGGAAFVTALLPEAGFIAGWVGSFLGGMAGAYLGDLAGRWWVDTFYPAAKKAAHA